MCDAGDLGDVGGMSGACGMPEHMGTQAGQWWYGTRGHAQGTAFVHPCIDGCDSMGSEMPGFMVNSVVQPGWMM